eukprot:g19177.t1
MGVVGKIWDVVSCQRRRAQSDKDTAQTVPQAAEAQAVAKALKEKGNELFKKHELEEALFTYTKAAEAYNYDASIWLNRSICNRKLENWEDAATDAEIAQELDPSNVKAYYNRAMALQLGSKLEEGLKVCKKGLEVQSDNKALQQLKADLQKSIKEASISNVVLPVSRYGCDNRDRRYLLSVYGNIFDVSDRPDKYDPDGPYASLTGKDHQIGGPVLLHDRWHELAKMSEDLTWGLFAGVDTVEYTNKFYDLFKARDMGKDGTECLAITLS